MRRRRQDWGLEHLGGYLPETHHLEKRQGQQDSGILQYPAGLTYKLKAVVSAWSKGIFPREERGKDRGSCCGVEKEESLILHIALSKISTLIK